MVSLCCDTTPVRAGTWEVTADDEGGGGGRVGGRGGRSVGQREGGGGGTSPRLERGWRKGRLVKLERDRQ